MTTIFKLFRVYSFIIIIVSIANPKKLFGQSNTNSTDDDAPRVRAREFRLTYSHEFQKIYRMTPRQLEAILVEPFPGNILLSVVNKNQTYDLRPIISDTIGNYFLNLNNRKKGEEDLYQLYRRRLSAEYLMEIQPETILKYFEGRSSDKAVTVLDCWVWGASKSESGREFSDETTKTPADKLRWKALLFSNNALCRVFAIENLDLWLQPEFVVDVVNKSLSDDCYYVRSNIIEYLKRKKPANCKALLKEYINRKRPAALRPEDVEAERILTEDAVRCYELL